MSEELCLDIFSINGIEVAYGFSALYFPDYKRHLLVLN